MPAVVIGVGDCQVSADPEAVLVTYALGSCIAVVIHDSVSKVGGLLHYLLPESSLDKAKAEQRPYMFAGTGIPLLFHRAYELGAVKSRLEVAVLGGAQVMDTGGTFNIGKRNHLALRKIFWKAGVLIHHEEVGGTTSRTVRLEVATGKVVLRQGAAEQVLNGADKKKGGDRGV